MKYEIEEADLLDLIHFARRYCDGRHTYSPRDFNQIYERIIKKYPEIGHKDEIDLTLTNKGQWWPYAQDGHYDASNGKFDAMPRKPTGNNHC